MSTVFDTKLPKGAAVGIVLLIVALIMIFLLDAILARVIKPRKSVVMGNGARGNG